MAPRAAWVVLAAALGAAAASLACAFLMPERVPEILGTPKEVIEAPVSTQQWTGSRSVTVSPQLSETRELKASATGTVTATPFGGGTLNSGTTALRIDDRPIVALHTDLPLYRPLTMGDSGDDVRALNRELGRLGINPGYAESKTYDWGTRIGVRKLFADGRDGQNLALEDIIWLPDHADQVSGWTPRVGATLTAGAIGSIPGRLTALNLTNLAASDQDRKLSVAGVTTTLPAGAASITDQAFLDQVAASAEGAQAIQSLQGGGDAAGAMGGAAGAAGMGGGTGGSGTLNGTVSLTEPVEVLRVPAAAVFGLEAGSGCVASNGKVMKVNVVGAELGVSLVSLAEGQAAMPGTVDLGSALVGKACR